MRRGKYRPKSYLPSQIQKGLIIKTSLTPLDLNTDLVYADGYTPPFMTLSPLKEKNPPDQEELYRLVGSYCIISL